MQRKLLGNHERGRLFIVSAPSGTGKTTLVKLLCDEFDCVVRSITCTTRPMRPGDVADVDYHFLTKEEFERRERAGDFLETAQVYDEKYGTLRESVEQERNKGKHVVLVIDTQGAEAVVKKMTATSIFIAPPSLEELKHRLTERNTDSEKSIEERLSWAQEEIEKGKNYDYLIVNEDLATAYEVLKSIFIAEEHSTRRKLLDD